MLRWGFAAAIAAVLAGAPAFAHGGGGYVAVPVIVPGAGPPSLPRPQIGDYSRTHTVAVLSAIGEKLTLRTSGGPLLGHGSEIDIRGWKIDDLATSIARRYLATRFAVKDVAYDRAALSAIPNGTWSHSDKAVQKLLAAVPAEGIDAFVVIRPDLEGNTGADRIEGLGLVTSGTTYPPVEWVTYEIDIIDAHSLERIGKAFSRAQLREGTGAQLPSFLMPKDRNLDGKLAPTDAQLAMLKGDFEFHLDNTLTETFRALDLGLTLPAPAARTLKPMPDAMDPFKSGKSVAIVSAVGDTLELSWAGTFFRHGSHTMAISDWKLDAEIEADIAKALDKHLSVKTVPFDRAKLAGFKMLVDRNRNPMPIDGLTSSTDVDLYVVALKRRTMIAADPSSGFALFKAIGLGNESVQAFVAYDIVCVDAHTLKVLGFWHGVASPKQSSPAPMRTLDNAVVEKDAATLNPGAVQTVHATLSDMMADSIPETLLRVGLTGLMQEKSVADADDAAAPATPLPSQSPPAAPAEAR